MTNEEYEEKIKDLEEQLEEANENYAEADQRADDLADENAALDLENDQLREFEVDKEEFAQKAFDRGVEAGIDFGQDKTKVLKAWLNYKIEARI